MNRDHLKAWKAWEAFCEKERITPHGNGIVSRAFWEGWMGAEAEMSGEILEGLEKLVERSEDER